MVDEDEILRCAQDDKVGQDDKAGQPRDPSLPSG